MLRFYLTIALLGFAAALSEPALSQVAPQAGPPKDSAIDFTVKLIGAIGKPLMQASNDCKIGDTVGKDCPLVARTLGDVAVTALESTIDEDRGLDPKKKFERDVLAHKIFDNKHAVLTVDEIALIKERIGKVYGPPEVGATWPILDPTLSR